MVVDTMGVDIMRIPRPTSAEIGLACETICLVAWPAVLSIMRAISKLITLTIAPEIILPSCVNSTRIYEVSLIGAYYNLS